MGTIFVLVPRPLFSRPAPKKQSQLRDIDGRSLWHRVGFHHLYFPAHTVRTIRHTIAYKVFHFSHNLIINQVNKIISQIINYFSCVYLMHSHFVLSFFQPRSKIRNIFDEHSVWKNSERQYCMNESKFSGALNFHTSFSYMSCAIARRVAIKMAARKAGENRFKQGK